MKWRVLDLNLPWPVVIMQGGEPITVAIMKTLVSSVFKVNQLTFLNLGYNIAYVQLGIGTMFVFITTKNYSIMSSSALIFPFILSQK